MSETGSAFGKLPYGQIVQSPDPDPVIPMRPDWHRGAPCNGKVDLFYPKGRTGIQESYAACRLICAACPFNEKCRAETLATEKPSERIGFRAGMTPQERHVASGTRTAAVCETCGELTALTRRFCSTACRRAGSPCLVCGENVGGDLTAHRKYCSDECKRAARRATAAKERAS